MQGRRSGPPAHSRAEPQQRFVWPNSQEHSLLSLSYGLSQHTQELCRTDDLDSELPRSRQVPHVMGHKITDFGFSRQLNKRLIVRVGGRGLPLGRERAFLG